MIYDYLCRACDHRFESEHKVNDTPPEFCRECGVVGEVRRQISKSTNFVLKGGGWASSGYGGLK